MRLQATGRPVVLGLWILVAVAPAACSRAPGEGTAQAALPPPVAAPAPAAEPQAEAEAPAAEPEVFEVSGTAAPARTSPLSAKGSGLLKKMSVRAGDRVRTGQVMVQLDPVDIALRAEAAAVAAEQAAEGVANAKRDLERVSRLYKAGALPDTNLEKIQLALRMAELQQKGADVGLRMAQQALADTRLRAPFDGVVTKVLAEEGQYITSMPPTMILVLVDTDTLEVRVPIPERRLSQIRVGLPVEVSLPALGVVRRASVDRLPAVLDPITRSAEAIIRLDNRDGALPAGTYARVKFPTVLLAADAPPGAAGGTPGAGSGER